jgi:hypothetical protein
MIVYEKDVPVNNINKWAKGPLTDDNNEKGQTGPSVTPLWRVFYTYFTLITNILTDHFRITIVDSVQYDYSERNKI